MVQEHGGEHTVSSRRAIKAAYMAPFRRIVSTRFDLGEAPLSDYAVRRKLGISTLDIGQAVHRLLHLCRVLQHMAAVLHDKLADLRDPCGQWQRWQAFILGFPVVWKRLVKSFSVVARFPRQQVPSPAASWPCYECGMTFKTSKALASHQDRSHQKERLSGRLSKTAIVPFAVHSSILAGVPCTIVILAAKLARAVCCHLLVSLCS